MSEVQHNYDVHLLICSYIILAEVSVPLCNTFVDFIDLIKVTDEILLLQLVISLKGYLVDMYLLEFTRLLEI